MLCQVVWPVQVVQTAWFSPLTKDSWVLVPGNGKFCSSSGNLVAPRWPYELPFQSPTWQAELAVAEAIGAASPAAMTAAAMTPMMIFLIP